MISKLLPQTDEGDVFDIVVIGAGPAGLMMATHMVRWGYKVLLFDERPTATPAGRADGLHPRSVELMDSMGFHDALWAHRPGICKMLNFWIGAGDGRLGRMASMPGAPASVDTRYPYVASLHQGLIEGFFLDDMAARGVVCQRPWSFTSFSLDEDDKTNTHPVTVNVESVDDPSEKRSVRAKYLFSGEGARSVTRQQAGIKMEWKDSATSHYGVMDAEVDSDFPDIREASVIQSSAGSVLLIPREKPKLVRVYVPRDDEGIGAPLLDHMKEQTSRIFHPFKVEWSNVEWLSHYSVRQGVAKSYGLGGRIFLGGDACHVHSPKMGQGMNLAFADAINLTWKIHAVEQGIAGRGLLATYEAERRQAAQDIIDFDYKYMAVFGQKLMGIVEKRARGVETTAADDTDLTTVFTKNARLITGYGLAYSPDSLLANWSVPPSLHLPSDKFRPGMCFAYTADITRVHDKKVVQFEQEIKMDGSFRIFIFAGHLGRTRSALEQLSSELRGPDSFLPRKMKTALSGSSSLEQRSKFFTVCLAYVPAGGESVEEEELLSNMSTDLRVGTDRIYMDDQDGGVAHRKAGLMDGAGGVIVVRPDGYVSMAVQLHNSPATGEALNSYFARLKGGVSSV